MDGVCDGGCYGEAGDEDAPECVGVLPLPDYIVETDGIQPAEAAPG